MYEDKNKNHFDCTDFHITRFPGSVIVDYSLYLDGVKRITLKGNRLNKLPEELTTLQNLVELDLQDNCFTTVPIVVTKLTKLQRLGLNDNLLTSLPEGIEKLTELRELYLFGNKLNVGSLSKKIGSFKHLNTLVMTRTEFDKDQFVFKEIIHFLANRQEIIKLVSHNIIALESVTDCFNQFDEIMSTSVLSEETEKEICERAIDLLKKMNAAIIRSQIDPKKRSLDCINVHLTRFSVDLLYGEFQDFWDNLRYLNLSKNHIRVMTVGVLPNLEGLYLSHNQLTIFPKIADYKKLRVLDVSANNISKINWPISIPESLQICSFVLNKFEYVPPELERFCEQNHVRVLKRTIKAR